VIVRINGERIENVERLEIVNNEVPTSVALAWVAVGLVVLIAWIERFAS
jgi:hypothetical protein